MYEINQELLKEKKKKRLNEEEKRNIIKSFKKVNEDDKILLLLSHIKGMEISASKDILHTTFYELKKNFPQHFSNFYFTTNENYPFCKRVDDIFFRLQNCRALSMKNPTYESYLITDEIKKIIRENIQPNIENEDQAFIGDLKGMINIVKKYLEHYE